MGSGYDISVDGSRRFHRLKLVGTLDARTVAGFTRDLRRGRETAGAHDSLDPTALLVDLRQMDLQTRDIASMIKTSIDGDAAMWTRIAVLLPVSPLHVMQVKRLSQHGNHAFFKDENEATAWLSARVA